LKTSSLPSEPGLTDDIAFRLMGLKAKGFCCAQIILILALEAQGKTNADLVRSVGGLCFGINGSGEVCGALSGGACLISLYAGKGSGEEAADDRYAAMAGELVNWFRASAGEYGGTRCGEILEKFPDRSMCGRIVADVYGKCMDILMSRGFDPAAGKT
jgi:C_GCAxxG_C_C family probable redox protein